MLPKKSPTASKNEENESPSDPKGTPTGYGRPSVPRRGRRAAAHELGQAPQRDERPHALQQQEPPLLVDERQHGEDRGADEVEDEVQAAVDRHAPGLGGGEAGEDEQRAGDLDQLVAGPAALAGREQERGHRPTLARPLAHRPRPP